MSDSEIELLQLLFNHLFGSILILPYFQTCNLCIVVVKCLGNLSLKESHLIRSVLYTVNGKVYKVHDMTHLSTCHIIFKGKVFSRIFQRKISPHSLALVGIAGWRRPRFG